ncbi:MAG TPA: ABC transporter ATP-binding protein [Hyphomicrobiaceae bacterium]|jgi:ATP-binding cassette subfamily B protein
MIVKDANTLRVLRRLVGEHGREYAPRYAIAFMFMGVVAGCTSLSAWMMKDVVNKIFVDQDQAALIWIPLAISGLFVIKGIAAYLQEISLSRIGNRIVAQIQKRMYDHMLKMGVGFYQQYPSSDLITRITQNAQAARGMLNLIAVGMGRDLLTLVGLIAVMISQDPILSAICLIGGPFAAVVLKRLSQRVQKAADRQYTGMSTIVGTMRESAQGIRIVKSFQLERMLQRRMNDGIDGVEWLANKIVAVSALVNPLIETLGGLAVAMAVVYAGWRNVSFGDTPGQFFAFITALLMAADPARRLSKLQLQLATAAIGVKMMYDLLDQPATEVEVDQRPDLIASEGEIRFEGVTFSYDPDTPVLSELDLIAPAGKTTALVGLSGAGKTTVFNLLQRFWEPARGVIRIDGQPISEYSISSLRRQIALVSQDVFLFEGTIRENIVAGRKDASEEEIVAAAKAAQADEFIRSLPNGYDTQVGELGSQISGGQRQRISLARAFLKNAPIILLDEPTSALDSETEQAIQSALQKLTRGRTTIVIAHRLATVANADLIHVMEKGRVVESGRHRELIERGGLYARLYQIQFANAIPSPKERDIAAASA